MPKQKQIENIKHRYSEESTLKCLWALRKGSEADFLTSGSFFIDRIVKQRVAEGVLEATRGSSTFKKSEVFKEAYLTHKGSMKKVMDAMEISDRTFFRYKKDFLDEETIEQTRKIKYLNNSKK